ncbi:hypothetical protein V5799_010701 [Amblyomma americanum]|uniref:Uncharacterized protein n=1 Tax=Amblyomma americanum TaxID=6943 RepID=A0AAQ4EIY8_AMBAM
MTVYSCRTRKLGLFCPRRRPFGELTRIIPKRLLRYLAVDTDKALLLTGFYSQPPVSPRCLPDPQAAAADWILDICNRCTDYLCAPQPFFEASNLLTWQRATISADQDTYIRRAVFTVPLGHGAADEMPRHSPFMLLQVSPSTSLPDA